MVLSELLLPILFEPFADDSAKKGCACQAEFNGLDAELTPDIFFYIDGSALHCCLLLLWRIALKR